MIGSSEYTARNINHLIWRVFNKSHGLTLQTEATSYIRDELNRVPFSGGNDEIITLLSRIAEEYKRCTGMLITLIFIHIF